MKKLISLLLMLLVAFSAMTLEAINEKLKAKLVNFAGEVEIKPAREKQWIAPANSMILMESDIVRTKKNSRAMIAIEDGDESINIELKENSQLMFIEFVRDMASGKKSIMLDIATGSAVINAKNVNKNANNFEIKTPTSLVRLSDGNSTFEIKVEQEE